MLRSKDSPDQTQPPEVPEKMSSDVYLPARMEHHTTAIDNFVDFFFKARWVSLKRNEFRSVEDLLSPSSYGGRSSVSDVFQSGTPLHRLLSAPAVHRPGFRSSVHIQKMSRYTSLLYLNVVLWEIHGSIKDTEQYLIDLRHALVDNELDIGGSIEALTWQIIRNKDALIDNPERLWYVTRLLNTAKQLRSCMWEKTQGILLQFLTGTETYDPEVFCELDGLRKQA